MCMSRQCILVRREKHNGQFNRLYGQYKQQLSAARLVNVEGLLMKHKTKMEIGLTLYTVKNIFIRHIGG